MVESLGDAAIRLVSLITGATDMSNEPTSPARDAGAVPRVREKSPTNSPGRKKNGMDLSLSACDGYPLMATIVPPQTTLSSDSKPTNGCHCLVIDVSGSMASDAKVTDDGADKVTHGFSILDIVKHATCTYVRSLGPDDYVCIVKYSSAASVWHSWTKCTDNGKDELDTAIRNLQTAGATNLRDGLREGMSVFQQLPADVAKSPDEYAMLVAVCTDGLPSAQYHPPGGSS